jgi:NAD(P)-dependent dehydrogenase (short-subunit alcohol dehydrogenase family)
MALLTDKVVAVTGAASGIGRATAMLAARSGARGLVLADLTAGALADAAAEAEAAGTVVETVAGDVAGAGTAEAVVARAVGRFGRLDAAVNAAGTMGDAAELVDYTDDAFDRILDVNVRGVFRCVRAELRQMYAQGRGSVVNLASASVYGVHTELGPYVASKSAVIGLTKVAAKEAGRRGVRVNAVCPGLTDTGMLRESMRLRPATSDIAAAIPLGRVGRPDELAEAIAWLCSDHASFTNGATLVVDGGRSG